MHCVLNSSINILTDDLLCALSDFDLYISTIDSIDKEINQSQDITYQKSVFINGLTSIKIGMKFTREVHCPEYAYAHSIPCCVKHY